MSKQAPAARLGTPVAAAPYVATGVLGWLFLAGHMQQKRAARARELRDALLRFCEMAHLGLRVRLVDADTRAPLAARVTVQQPPGALRAGWRGPLVDLTDSASQLGPLPTLEAGGLPGADGAVAAHPLTR